MQSSFGLTSESRIVDEPPPGTLDFLLNYAVKHRLARPFLIRGPSEIPLERGGDIASICRGRNEPEILGSPAKSTPWLGPDGETKDAQSSRPGNTSSGLAWLGSQRFLDIRPASHLLGAGYTGV
ncbi:hypothetical protein VNO77_14245 [Canavalia gladiata]|uniref:Uncharacterized protein n=1 Tax=Canavalia gladiata TaxID=3824 RepID=A0AAN9LY10_CANGL